MKSDGVNEFSLVNEEPRECETVGGAGSVLRNHNGNRAVIERDDILPLLRLDNGCGKSLGRASPDHIMHAFFIAPPRPCSEECRESVGKTVLESW